MPQRLTAALLIAGFLCAVSCTCKPPEDPPLPMMIGVPSDIQEPLHLQSIAAFHSKDLKTWTELPSPPIKGFDSLGLSVRADGKLWVTGNFHRTKDSTGNYFGKTILAVPPNPNGNAPIKPVELHGLQYDEAWSPITWTIDDPESRHIIDPQWIGDELWYIGFGELNSDPMLHPEPNRVRSFPNPATRYAAQSLTDPNPVRFNDELFLFFTLGGREIVEMAGDPLTEVHRWKEKSVPFATVIDEELWLLSQALTDSRTLPVLTRSKDGRAWSEWMPLVLPKDVNGCSSPVIAKDKGGYLLLCATFPK
jgi:hypothetical protein